MQVFLKNIAIFIYAFSVASLPTWISRILGWAQGTLFNHIFQIGNAKSVVH